MAAYGISRLAKDSEFLLFWAFLKLGGEKSNEKMITMNKASGGDGIPVELFQILKDGAMKVLY